MRFSNRLLEKTGLMAGVKMQASIAATCFSSSQFPKPGYPEVAFAGRSNVGKSTFINGIIQQRLAHVSSTPGKTRSINFYKVSGRKVFFLVDLPGFGFAQRARTERRAWADMIGQYISGRETLVLLIHLVDFRHGLLENDRMLQEWAEKHNVPVQVVFTKIDKIPKGKWASLFRKYSEPPFLSISDPLMVSMEKGWGLGEFGSFLDSFLDSVHSRAWEW